MPPPSKLLIADDVSSDIRYVFVFRTFDVMRVNMFPPWCGCTAVQLDAQPAIQLQEWDVRAGDEKHWMEWLASPNSVPRWRAGCKSC